MINYYNKYLKYKLKFLYLQSGSGDNTSFPVSSGLSKKTINMIFLGLSKETINKIFSELSPETINMIFLGLSKETINKIFSELSPETIHNLRLNQDLIIKILMNCSQETLSKFFINYLAADIILSFNHNYDYEKIKAHFEQIDKSNTITIYTQLYDILYNLKQSNTTDRTMRDKYIEEYFTTIAKL